MPQKSWVPGEEVLAADFNTYLQNQSVAQFTATSQRDTQWPTPPVGAFCVTTDTGTLWQRGSSAWYKPFAVQARRSMTADQGGITTVTDLGGLNPVVTVPAGRLLLITCEAIVISTVVNDVIVGYITDTANVPLARWCQVVQTGSPAAGQKQSGSVYVTPAAGTFQWKARLERNNGTGTVTCQAGASYPALMTVTDMGAA